ncbi:hypothetical protein GE09DRAFT_974279 [Coniochaeta sp. 2T2.1]|nr:hypothetical protein GE09DRAFT_974279 [Coniochaeta sp. 2T2.1]
MLSPSLLLLTLATTLPLTTAQTTGPVTAPPGYRAVYITSKVDAKFVVSAKTPVKAGNTIVVNTQAANKPEQQWWLTATTGDSKIQLANTTLCLDAGAKTTWKDMANIYVKDCTADAADPSQLWNVMADGRIALKASSPQECIDLQYMRATANNPVGLYACAGLGNTGAADKGINWPLVNVTAGAA